MNSQIQSIIENIVERLKEAYQPEKIILFGSYAWGGATDESDIDLLIVKNTQKPFAERWVEICNLVDEIVLSIPFSPFVITPDELRQRIEIGDQFFQQILDRGKELYAK